MSKEYRSILKYEREILELRKEGLTRQEIANRLGLKFTQIKDFIKEQDIDVQGYSYVDLEELYSCFAAEEENEEEAKDEAWWI